MTDEINAPDQSCELLTHGDTVVSSPRDQYPLLRVVVVIPCYRVRDHILGVLSRIPTTVWRIVCIDDCCPDFSGDLILKACNDERVVVVKHEVNQGVGGAMISGYRTALALGADIVVKVDGDGQMDPDLIHRFVRPLVERMADYTKGNRFYNPEGLASMPFVRLVANAGLSFMSKLSTGYWSIFDPTNGFTAIHVAALRRIPLDKLSRRYFFETDLLFRLGTLRAVVVDVPMEAVYGDEVSNLSPVRVLLPFLRGHIRNFFKRVLYSYALRDFSFASVLLITGVPMILWGVAFGARQWIRSVETGIPSSSGTVMLATLPIVLGAQAILAALSYDIASAPTVPLSRLES